jgi:hypothetical protein
VTQDKPTRKILENFAEAYWESERPISLLKSISDLAGGAIPFILAAVLTKRPEAFSAEVVRNVRCIWWGHSIFYD